MLVNSMLIAECIITNRIVLVCVNSAFLSYNNFNDNWIDL
jgi:hypothetical protein